MRRHQPQHGRRDRHLPLRGRCEGPRHRHRHLHLQAEDGSPAGRGAGWRPHSPHHRPRPHKQGVRGARQASFLRLPQHGRRRPCPARLHPGAEDGGQGLRLARRVAGHVRGAKDDDGGQPGHHRPDDARRAEGLGLPRLLCRPGHAVLLPHRRLPEAGGCGDSPHPSRLHPRQGWCLIEARRWHHPLVAQPHALARHRGHRWRLPHPLPHWHLLPGRLRPGGVRSCRWRHALGHARVSAGQVLRLDAARHHSP
mmetsp:Transcript_34030/g.79595  ORF Transcript_34030/g.79595 Transcript_34030/m.79595 type:complete len:253 (+) Transcript_34030:727-1485(+)